MKRLAVLALLGACGGNSGTVSVTLTTAPGSNVLDTVQTLRITNIKPMQVHDVSRTSRGFDLSLDFNATGELTSLLVDGLDASGTLAASGASPPFTLGPLNGDIKIYMAAPNSVAASPATLDPPRSELGVGALSYGALLVGGRLMTAGPSDALSIYNAFDHSIVEGLALPAPRTGLAVGIGAQGIAYLFGGTDASGSATETLWRFDTTVAPAGQYTDFGDKSGFARGDALLVPIGNEHFLLTGMPVADVYGLAGSITAKTDPTSLPNAGAGLVATDGTNTAIFASADGVVRYHGSAFGPLDLPVGARDGATVAALPAGKVAIVCGAGAALRIDAAAGTAQEFADVPRAERTSGCAVAATPRHLVVAGGTLPTGEVAPTAEIFDAETLDLVATSPLVVPRTGAHAIALPNGQVLIAGGTDAAGNPIATLELFTPAN